MHKPWYEGPLMISDNKRYFTNGDTPLFLLGDTAWSLFQKLSIEETYIYLRNRQEKGYNVIQAVLVNFWGNEKSAFAHEEEKDITEYLSSANDPFWNHVSKVVEMAEELGLYMALLPVWGKVVKLNRLNMDNVKIYTEFLSEKFGSSPNVFWILGGDIRGDAGYDVWDTMGKIFKEKTPDKIIGFHPFGRTCSSYWFQECDWLDFHMFQSGHRRNDQRSLNAWDDAANKEPWYGEASYLYVKDNINKKPYRPIMDGEPSYEQLPQGLHDPNQPYWQAHHVRRYAYWSVLSGAAGHMYGHNAIIQFHKIGDDPVYGVKEPWYYAIHDLGAAQMKIIKDLMELIDFTKCSSMESVLKQDNSENPDDINIAFGNENEILIYNYSGKEFSVKNLEGAYDCFWVDPSSGVRSFINKFTFESGQNFTPPNKKSGFNDWLLYLGRTNMKG